MITIDSTTYDWQYIDGDLVLMSGDVSLIFKDAKIAMERVGDKELDAAKANCGKTHWPIMAEQEFVHDVMNDQSQLKAYCLGAWNDKIVERSEPYESEQLKRTA